MSKTPDDFTAKIELIDIKKLKGNPTNPRIIKRSDYERLKKSIKDNPKMMKLRPVVFDGDKVIAGNQRLRACTELGWKKIPGINASKLTRKEKDHFILWDNENAGSWDLKELATLPTLFGIKVPELVQKNKYDNTNCEMPIVPKFDEKYRAVLIVVENEMEFANLCTKLKIGVAKDYKTTKYKQTQVIHVSDFLKAIEKWKK